MTGTVDHRGDGTSGAPHTAASDLALWQRSATAETVEDEGERFLDLAGFADGRLDPDESERVAERLARDPDAAADVAAARALATRGAAPEAAPAPIIARACALVSEPGPERGQVILFPQLLRLPSPTLPGVARWASLAAAILVASWLGFALGTDVSVSFGQPDQASDDGFLRDMLDPSTAFLRDLTPGART
jgi:anti-sigma factor RsiW